MVHLKMKKFYFMFVVLSSVPIGLIANQGVMNYLDKHAHDKPATGFGAFLVIGTIIYFIFRVLIEIDFFDNKNKKSK